MRSRVGFPSRTQDGAALVLVAFMAFGLTAAAGLAADAGALYFKRTQMQAAADAAALAGAHGLLDGRPAAIREARQLAAENGYELDDRNVSFPPGSRVKVSLRERASLLLSGLLGMADPDVAVSSGGELHCVASTAGIRPWGVPDRAFGAGQEVLLKLGAGAGDRGNYRALALDGPGAATYFAAILHGSKRSISTGELVSTQPGNVSGPTAIAVEQLIAGDRADFAAAVRAGERSPRIVTLALLDPKSLARLAGRSQVRVSGFARFYLARASARGEVVGRFIDRVARRDVPGTASRYAVRLVE